MPYVARIFACLSLLCSPSLRANDSFAQATDLNTVTLPYYGFITGGGTAEPGEPGHAGTPAANSRWFKWTATATSACIIREYLNGNSARIAIYTGNTVSTLTLIAQGTQPVYFPCTQGVTYHIAIDSLSSDVIQFKPYPAGGADDIANADLVVGTLPLRIRGHNALATAATTDEDWHPEYNPTASVWWKWTAPATGIIRLDARRCDFGTLITTYAREPGGSPVRDKVGFLAVGLNVTAGYEYFFCMDTSDDPGEIDLWLEWVPTTPPANDHIANANDLGSTLIACDGGWIYNATPEAGLPGESIGFPQWGIPGDRTLWWKWTCPQAGTYRVSMLGTDAWPRLTVFTGTPAALSYLTETEATDGITFAASAGTLYWIRINDNKKTSTRAELNLHPGHTDTPYFRHFSNRGTHRLLGTQRHPEADPDGDGFSNQIEFACAANPEVHNPNDPNLPRLLPHNGGWKFQWGEDTQYTSNTRGQPVSLFSQTSPDLAAPWANPTTQTDPATGRRFIILPTAPTAFARLSLNDPNWNLTP